MKTQADLVKGWLRKAESDITAAQLCITEGTALDAACFHAQQAAEKCLKAYLIAHGISFPYTHNLEKLVELCISNDPSFSSLKGSAGSLTPYAVELRYDDDFWPLVTDAHQALEAALAIRDHVLERLPAGMKPQN